MQPYLDCLDAEADRALAARLNALVALAAKGAGRQVRGARLATYLRLGVTMAASGAEAALGGGDTFLAVRRILCGLGERGDDRGAAHFSSAASSTIRLWMCNAPARALSLARMNRCATR
jgi:hypothetical protein